MTPNKLPREYWTQDGSSRHAHVDLSLSTGGGGTFPLVSARKDSRIHKVRFLPSAAFAVDASDYWTLVLMLYDETGTEWRTIANSQFSTGTYPLAVGRAIIWPAYGLLDEAFPKDYTAHVKATETGTAADIGVRVQLEYDLGR